MLTAAALLPLALMAGIGLYVMRDQQSARTSQVGLELARSVANAVDAELRSAISVVEALSTTPTLDRNDLDGFRERARRIVAARPGWAAIVLSDGVGTPLVDTRFAPGIEIEPVIDQDSFERAAQTRGPVVGGLTRHRGDGWLFAVRVPVSGGGRLRYVVTALIRPDVVRDVLTRQQVPADWVISIMDAGKRRVARSRAHLETLGGALSDSAQAVVDKGGDEGSGVSYTLEGEESFTPFSRVATSGWTAVLGIPMALIVASAWRSLAVYGGGAVLSIVLGTLAALWVARSITRPIADLRAAAEALGRRERPVAPSTPIREIRDVGIALETAGEALAAGEAERDSLLAKERQAREAAEAADRAKDEFMAVLSHELRTPLNAVFGWARMLQDGQLRDEAMVARAKEAIVRNADVQVQLIDDLLDLSRITSGKMRLDVRAVDLPEVLDGALDVVRPAAAAKGIALTTDFEPIAAPVAGDPGRLQQIVWNLLMNAVKFTPAGGQVELRLRGDESSAEVVVSDTGQGIPADMLPHVFERFRQGDSSSTRTHGGLGLGLALVKHLAELHGGSVSARSDGVGRGSTFVVSLPLRRAAAPDGLLPAPGTLPAGAAPRAVVRLDGLRVLVADDDADARMLAEAVLESAGAEVRSCPTAAAALDLLRRWRPDVLVSDVGMPGDDGYALIGQVRRLPADGGGRTPAVALTAFGGPKDRLRSLAKGFDMHVPKPVDPGELTAIIAGVVDRTPRSVET